MKTITSRDRKLMKLMDELVERGHDFVDLMMNPQFHQLVGRQQAKALSKQEFFEEVAKLSQAVIYK